MSRLPKASGWCVGLYSYHSVSEKFSEECWTNQEIEGLAAYLKRFERVVPSVNRKAVCIDDDSLVKVAPRHTAVSSRGRGWGTKQESCFYPSEDNSLQNATSLGESISLSPSKMCRMVKASSWCSGLTNVSDTTDMETDFPAHGIMSLDDALKEFERLAAFRPVCRRGKQGNTKLESSMSNEDVFSDATSFGWDDVD